MFAKGGVYLVVELAHWQDVDIGLIRVKGQHFGQLGVVETLESVELLSAYADLLVQRFGYGLKGDHGG